MRGYPKIEAKGKLDKDWSEENKDWYIEEKVDGSQLSFNARGDFFNRGRLLEYPCGWVFDKAIAALSTLQNKLNPDYMYHGECIVKPKHNVLWYGRVPKFFFVLFDVQDGECNYLQRDKLEQVAQELGIECVQLLYQNVDAQVQPRHVIPKLLESSSCMLGGNDKPEGIVVKHPRFTKPGGKVSALKVKIVRKEFKEKHHKPQFKPETQELSPEESLMRIMSWYSKEARWEKASQRLRDRGELSGDPIKDRGKIMEEARRDFMEEEKQNLKHLLWAEFGQRLVQSITEGMGEKLK